MAGPFNNDPDRRPDLPRSPWWDWDDVRNRDRTPPSLPMPPSSGPGLPWWVDPRFVPTRPNLLSAPSLPPQPAPPQVPMSRIDPSEAAPNQPLSYYDRNANGQRRPSNSTPAGVGPAAGAVPAETAGNLIALLYAMMRPRDPKQEAGLVSNPKDASQVLPERRLGRCSCHQ